MDEEANKLDKIIEIQEKQLELLTELVNLTKDMHKNSREMSIRLQEIKAQTS